MSDHISGPRAIADPVIDITDVYAFPCPESPQHLVLIMNVFPYAGPSAVFSDAVIYRLRVRSVSMAPDGRAIAVAADESIFDCTFSSTQTQECLLEQEENARRQVIYDKLKAERDQLAK